MAPMIPHVGPKRPPLGGSSNPPPANRVTLLYRGSDEYFPPPRTTRRGETGWYTCGSGSTPHAAITPRQLPERPDTLELITMPPAVKTSRPPDEDLQPQTLQWALPPVQLNATRCTPRSSAHRVMARHPPSVSICNQGGIFHPAPLCRV